MGHFGSWRCWQGVSLDSSWGSPSPFGMNGTAGVTKVNRFILLIGHLRERDTQNMHECLNSKLQTLVWFVHYPDVNTLRFYVSVCVCVCVSVSDGSGMFVGRD